MGCNGFLGLIFVHNFRPIITKDQSKPVGSMTNASMDFFDKFRNETFNGIYCKRCGEVRK